jgi:hypothetical protein
MHILWITELLRWIKPRLPAGFRAYLGSAPVVAIGAPERPDVGVRQWSPQEAGPAAGDSGTSFDEPDEELAVGLLEPSTTLYVERQGALVAAVELISPRNKDRHAAQTGYASRYAGYLLEGVHLLLVDVHRRPLSFSFADQIAVQLQMPQPPLPAPLGVSYRVGGPAAVGGRMLGIWRRPLTVGQPLPLLPLPITMDTLVEVDLEQTYQRAAADAYLG